MKKIILSIAAVTFSCAAWADFPKQDFPQQDFPSANPKLEAAITTNMEDSQQTAGRTHDDAVFDMVLTVESKFVTNAEPYTFDKPCSAVLIDKNWMIASLYCRGVGEIASAYDHHGEISYRKKVEYRKIIKAAVRAKATHARDVIWPRDIFVNEKAKVILLRLDQTNRDLMDEVNTNGGKVASLLIPNNPQLVAQYAHEGYINREHCLPGRCSDAVGLNCTGKDCFETDWEMIDGDAGDPLFVVSSRDKKSEYLFGFNNAEIVGSNSQSGSTYTTFTQPVYREILNTIRKIDPAAVERIHSRAKNEKILH